MADTSGKNKSLWLDTASQPTLTMLSHSLTADICVVGGGIAGLTTAYLLMNRGKSVVVIEDGKIGGGETGRTSGHLSNALVDRYYVLEEERGEDGARRAAESHTVAIDTIEKIIGDERINCDFKRLDGYLFLGPDDRPDTLNKELAAARRAGLSEVALHSGLPVGPVDLGPCLRFPNQAQFHSIKYLSGLAAAIVRNGGKIYDRTHVTSVKDGEPCVVTVKNGHTVTAKSVVIATNTPINDWVAIHTKQASYRSYVVGLSLPKNSIPEALYWDTADPYHYVRLHDGLLIVGGEDHKTGQEHNPQERTAALLAWAREKFPLARDMKYQWSGQIVEPVDGLAYIGRNPGEHNVYIVTGDSGNGLTHGTIAGLLIDDLVDGKTNPWEALYDPSRIAKPIGKFLHENLNTLVQYKDWVAGGDVSSVDQIPPGEGAVMQEGLKKVAVCKNTRGHILRCSAVCPHLGAVVRWNSAEKTWDCPAHGSRFDAKGHVINGPANTDLTPKD
jgi:glycine/D-amino acid oxidase-like deaminating enzyme/nitrite reductase/ring-hydroxylating ferredoxin subunit